MPGKTSILLIRHGQSAGNAEGRFGGHSATPLSHLGKQQAETTAKILAKERISAIYSSDLFRAVETAEPLAQLLNLEINQTEDFRERHVGVLEGLTFDEAKQQYPKDYYALVNRNLKHRITNGESYFQLLARVKQAFRQILRDHQGEKVAIFSHTGVICFLTLDIVGAIHPKNPQPPWLVTSNCGINRFEFRSRTNIKVLSVNDTRHLSEVSGNDSFAAK